MDMARGFDISIDEYYHVYNRGNGKRRIFRDIADRERFIKLLYLCNGTKSIKLKDISHKNVFLYDRGDQLVDICTYCLMGNHFHLLLKEKVEGGISKFMQKLATAYSMYFNIKYKHSGTPFEGTYKAKHIDSDPYLKYIFSYIHMNPIEHIEKDWKEVGIRNSKRALEYAENYKYSSLRDYLGEERLSSNLLNRKAFPDYFEDVEGVKREIIGWLNYTLEV